MSFIALNWTWHIMQNYPEMPSRARLVLHTLAHRHNQETGLLNPSIARLMKDTGLSKRSVQYGIKDLENAKIIKVIRRKEKGKLKNKPSIFLFLGANDGCKYCTEVVQILHPETGNTPQPQKPSGYFDLIITEDRA